MLIGRKQKYVFGASRRSRIRNRYRSNSGSVSKSVSACLDDHTYSVIVAIRGWSYAGDRLKSFVGEGE